MQLEQPRILIGTVGAFLAVWILSCSNGLEPTPTEPCPDGQEVVVSVNSDPRPVFSWSPACGMASLEVRPSTGSALSGWVLFTGSRAAENPLRSRVRYGDAPPESLEPAPATQLEPSIEYTITVSRWVGDAEGGTLIPRGFATFIR